MGGFLKISLRFLVKVQIDVISTFRSQEGVITTSIVVMGNGVVSVGHIHDSVRQIVCFYNEKTNVYASFFKEPSISLNLLG